MLKVISPSKIIDCAFFDLNLPELINTLKTKQHRIILDKENIKKVKNNFTNIQINYDKQLMHNKFCIIDQKYLITGSMNPTKFGSTRNNNNLIIIKSPSLIHNYQQEFEELWNEQFGEGFATPNPVILFGYSKIENYFCPEDHCKEKVLNTLNQAQSSIYFMTFSFTDTDISDLLIKKAPHLEIKGIFEKKRLNMDFEQYKKMQRNNLNILPDKNKGTMHHKVFIIDKKIIITGSYNPTWSANNKNDENILIIHNKKIAKQFLEEFNYLWKNE
jgi:phosphatidylserine/phosphatidylglycerophosphate/cardiolipin synthase-like enzyme